MIVEYVGGTAEGAVYNVQQKKLTITVIPGETTAQQVIDKLGSVSQFTAIAAEGATYGVIKLELSGSTGSTGVDPGPGGIPAGKKAHATIRIPGPDNDLTFTAATPGEEYNDVTVEYVDSQGAEPSAAYTDGTAKTLTIKVKSGITTAAEIVTLLQSVDEFSTTSGAMRPASGSTGSTGVDAGPVGIPAGKKAHTTIRIPGPNNDLTFTATTAGVEFNDVIVEYVSGGALDAVYNAQQKKLTITVVPGTTAAEVITRLQGVNEFSATATSEVIRLASGSTGSTGSDEKTGRVIIKSPGEFNDLKFVATATTQRHDFSNVTVQYFDGITPEAVYDPLARKLSITVRPGVTTAADIISLMETVPQFAAFPAEGETGVVINTAPGSTGTTGVDAGAGGTPEAVPAKLTIKSPGPNNDVTFIAKEAGTAYNNVTVEYANGATLNPLTGAKASTGAVYNPKSKQLIIAVVPGKTTASDVIAAVNNKQNFQFRAVKAEAEDTGVINTASRSTGSTGGTVPTVPLPPPDNRRWFTLKEEVGAAEMVGIDGLTIRAESLLVAINDGSGQIDPAPNQPVPTAPQVNRTVVAYDETPLTVKTGPGETDNITFDFPGSSGKVHEAAGKVTIDLFGVFYVSGGFAFTKQTRMVRLANATTGMLDPQDTRVDVLTVGAGKVNAFFGNNGPYWTDLDGDGKISWADKNGNPINPAIADTNNDGVVDTDETEELSDDAMGIALVDVNFALAMMKPSPQLVAPPPPSAASAASATVVSPGPANDLVFTATATGFAYNHVTIEYVTASEGSEPTAFYSGVSRTLTIAVVPGVTRALDVINLVAAIPQFNATATLSEPGATGVINTPTGSTPTTGIAETTVVSPGPKNDLKFTASSSGSEYTVAYASGEAFGVNYNTQAKKLTVTVVDGTTTAAEVRDAVNAATGIPFTAEAVEAPSIGGQGDASGVIHLLPSASTGVIGFPANIGRVEIASFGPNNDLTFVAKTPGTEFNNVTVKYVNGTSLAVDYPGPDPQKKTLTITIESGVTKAFEVIDFLNHPQNAAIPFRALASEALDDGILYAIPSGSTAFVPQALLTKNDPTSKSDLLFVAKTPDAQYNNVTISLVDNIPLDPNVIVKPEYNDSNPQAKKLTIAVKDKTVTAAMVLHAVNAKADLPFMALLDKTTVTTNDGSGTVWGAGPATTDVGVKPSARVVSPGPNNDLLFTAETAGNQYNEVTVKYVPGTVPGPNDPPAKLVEYSPGTKTLTIRVVPATTGPTGTTEGTTANDIIQYLDQNVTTLHFRAVAIEKDASGAINLPVGSTGVTGGGPIQGEGVQFIDNRSWTSLKASAGSVALVGGPGGITLRADDLAVAINIGGGNVVNPTFPPVTIDNNKVVSLNTTPLSIKIGPPVVHQNVEVGRSLFSVQATPQDATPLDEPPPAESNVMVLDIDGTKGEVLEASGHISLNVYDFFHVSGHFAFVKRTESVRLYDTATGQLDSQDTQVDLLTLGAGGVNAFAGVNGPYFTDLDGDGQASWAAAEGNTLPEDPDTDNDGVVDADETDELNDTSLRLSLINVHFALALMSPSKTPPVEGEPEVIDKRSWIALKAGVGSAEFVGIDGLTVRADDLMVAINQAGGTYGEEGLPNTTVVDFETKPLDVKTGGGEDDFVTMDFRGADGKQLMAAGSVTIGVLDFFHVSGDFAFEKKSTLVRLYDTDLQQLDTVDTSVDLLTVGAGNVNAFVGVGGPYILNDNGTPNDFDDDTVNESALGLSLHNVHFAMAMMTVPKPSDPDTEPVDLRKWMAIEAGVGAIELVGIEGLTLEARHLRVAINQGSGEDEDGNANTTVVDFSSRPLDVRTGPGEEDFIRFDFDGEDGSLLEASGEITIAAFGFFYVTGGFSLRKQSETVRLRNTDTGETDTEGTSVDLLTIGASGVTAFAGINGPYWTDINRNRKVDGEDLNNNGVIDADESDELNPKALGISLENVNVAFAMMKPRAPPDQEPTDLRTWTAIDASVGGARFVGVDGLTLAVQDLGVQINQGGGIKASPTDDDFATPNNTVVDFQASFDDGDPGNDPDGLDVSTGPNSSIRIAYRQKLLRAQGTLVIGIFDFFFLSGSFAFEKTSHTVTLSDGTSQPVNLLTIGAGNVSAFAGINGPYILDDNDTPNYFTDDIVNESALGLSLQNVNFALALMSAPRPTLPADAPAPEPTDDGVDLRTWTALQASVGSAEFVGIDGLTIQVREFSVSINQNGGTLGDGTTANPNTTFVDFSADATKDGTVGTPLDIKTGPDSFFTMALDGKTLLEASGRITLNVFGFFYLSGGFAFTKTTDTVTLSDGTSQTVDLMTVGAGNVNAFAGINGPYILDDNGTPKDFTDDTVNESVLGLSLYNVNFALALMSVPKPLPTPDAPPPEPTDDGADLRTWTALQASVGRAEFVGIEGLTIQVREFSVSINQNGGTLGDGSTANPNTTFVDFSVDAATDGTAGTPLDIKTGPDSFFTMALDGMGLLETSGRVTLDVFGFVILEGSFAFKKATGSFVLTDAGTHQSDTTTLANVDYLEVGAHVTRAFAGVGDIGFELTGVDFGLLMVKTGGETPVSYTALKADVGSAALVGIPGLTAKVTQLSVQVNKTSDTDNSNKVLDFVDSAEDVNITDTAAAGWPISTGPAPAPDVILDLDGDDGALLQVSAALTLDVFGFFFVDGTFAFSKSTQTVNLSDGTTGVQADALQLGATVSHAFAEVNGPYWTDTNKNGQMDAGETNDASLGLSLSNVEFAMALLKK